MKPSRLTSFPQGVSSQERPFFVVNRLSGRAVRVIPEILKRGLAAVLAAFALFGFNPQVLAATDTWVGADTGGSPTTDWANADNWAADTQPVSGDSLVFTNTNGQSTTTLTDSLTTATFVINGITFNAGAVAYILTGNAFDLGAAIVNNSSNTQTINNPIALSTNHTFTTNGSGGNLNFGGAISDGGSGYGVTVNGGGTVTLNAQNTYTGSTSINGNTTLALNFAAAGAPTTNIISTSSALILNGGTLSLNSAGTQTFANTTLNNGFDVISVTGNSTVSVGTTFTYEPGGTLEFIGPEYDTAVTTTAGQANGGDVAATGSITTPANVAGNENFALQSSRTGITDASTAGDGAAFGEVGLYDFAIFSPSSPYTIIGASQGTGGLAGSNGGGGNANDGAYNLLNGTNFNSNYADGGLFDVLGTDTAHNTDNLEGIRFNANASATVAGSGDFSIGGFLVTPNVGAFNDFITVDLQTGQRGADLGSTVFFQNNNLGFLDIQAVLQNNSNTNDPQGGTYVQSGAGTISYQGVNTYTGQTYLNGGVSEITADSAFGAVATAAAVNLNGGTIFGSVTMSLDNAGANARPITLYSAGGGLAELTALTFTADGLITGGAGTGPLIIGIPASAANGNTLGLVPGTGTINGTATANTAQFAAGTVVVTNASNTYTGGTLLESGVLRLNTNTLGTTTGVFGGTTNGGPITLNGGTFQWGTGITADISAQGLVVGALGGILDSDGNNVTMANPIRGTGTLTVVNSTGSGSINLSANNPVFNGSVAVNSGNLIISGTKAYSGTTSINGGTLTLAVGGGLGNTAITDFNSGTITAALSGNQNFNIGTTGATLLLRGGSTLSLQAADADTLDTLTLNSVAATGAGTVLTVGGANSANIDFDLGSAGSAELVINDGVTSFGANGGKIFINDLDTNAPLSSYTLVSDPSGGLLAGGSSAGPDFWLGTTGLSFGGLNYGLSLATTGTSIVLNFTVNNPNFYWTGATNGSWATSSNFAADASGTTPQNGSFSASSNVFLTANSASNLSQTLDGNYAINSLSFTGTGTSAGSSSITLASGTGTALTINAGNSFVDSNGNNYASGTGLVVQPGSAAHTISANIELGNSQVWNINNSGTTPLTVTGVVSDAVAGDGDSLTKTGTGTLILSAPETYDGGTIISAGTVRLGPGGSLLPAGKLTVNGGRLNLNGNSQTVGGLSDGGVSTGIITSATGSSVLTVNDNSAAIYSGTITDNNASNGASLGLVFSGSASETISGSNNYTGGTTVSNGTLIAANNYALGSSTSSDGGLLLNPSVTARVNFTSANPNIASLASSGAGASTVLLGSASNGGTSTTLTIGGGGATTVFNGVISDQPEGNTNAFGNLTVSGGSLTLGGANTFTGTTVISGGTLIIGNPLALQFSNVNYNNQGGVLSFGSQTAVTLGGLQGAQSLPFVNSNSAAVALTLGNNPSVNDIYSGNLNDSGLGSSITMAGGAITLAGTDAYTGTTTINAGTLTITGSVGSAAAPSGAVLLDGAINSILTVSGGSLYAPSLQEENTGTINMTGGLISVSGAFALSIGNAGFGFANLTGGTLDANSLAVNRDNTNFGAAAPAAGLTTEGVYVNGATVNIATTLADGNGGGGDASSNNVRMDSGSITVGGITTITNDAGSRFSVLDINGGVFTDNDTTGIGIQLGGNADTTLDAELLVRNGVLNTPAITLGNTTDNGGTLEFQDIGGTTNIGAGGIVSTAPSPTVITVIIGSTNATTAPVIAASASWSSSLAMTLANSSGGAAPTFQTLSGNISLSGTLSGAGGLTAAGAGTLTLSGANSYTGITTINGGTLLADSATALGTASSIVFSGGTLEYSALDTTDYSAVIVNSPGPVTINTNGQNILFATAFVASDTGGLRVSDSAGGGSLTLTSSNSYSAATTIGSGGVLILSSTGTSVAALGNTAISVASGGTFAVKPNSGNIQIGSTGASLALAAGANFTMADGTVGTLTVNGNGSASALNLGGTATSPDNLTFDLGVTGADQLVINNGGVTFAASSPQSDVFLDAVNAPSSLTGIPLLVAPEGVLSLSDFFLSTQFVTFGGSIYTASLSLGDSNTELLLSFVQGAPTTYYFTGAQSSSWSNINNFATDHTGAFPQSSGSLSSLSDVFLTDDNPQAGNFATETLDGNYTINSLSFSGTGTGAATTPITLASSSGATAYTLTLEAGSSFSDANGNSYPTGTGLAVQPGSAAQTISANVDLGASQTWEINNSAANPLTVSGVIADAPSTTHDSLTITGSGELILTNANTYDGGTTVSGGTLMLGTGGSISSTGVLTVKGTGTFDLGGNSQAVGGLSDGGASTGTITTSIGASTLTVNNAAPESFSGTITDNSNVNGASLALYLAGPANYTLSGSNSFTGGVTLGAGNLTVANNYALGSGTAPNAGLTFNNIAISNVYFTSANPQLASVNDGPSQTGAANIILGGTASGGAPTTLFLGGGGTAQTAGGDTFSGSISDLSSTVPGAVGNLAIIGGAFVELTGANTFTGTTVISGSGAEGTSLLLLGNALALEDSTLNYNNQGGTISFGSITSATLGGLTGSQSLQIPISLTIGNNNEPSFYTGLLSGAGSIIKTGTGTVQFGSGTNGGASYTGSTAVVSGTLIIGGNSDLTGGVDLTAVPAAAGGVGLPNGLIVQDDAVINAPSEIYLSSNDGGATTNYAGVSSLLVTGTASVTAPSLSIGHTSRVESGDFITINDSASLTVNGVFTLLSTEGGTASTTTINLNGGTLTADTFALGQGSNAANQIVNFYFNGGVFGPGASDNYPTTTFFPDLAGLTAYVTGGAIINTNGFNVTMTQPLVSGSSADGGLTKIGSGILTLGTSNTYNGPTRINGGELALANINSIEDTSGITFSGSGGALQYSGSNTKDYSPQILNSTAAVAIDTNGQKVTFASPLASSNVGGLTVENAIPSVGGLTLTASNAYTGPTLVQSGADLILAAGGSTPAGSAVTVSGSGSLQALTGNGGIGGSLSLASGGTLSLVDGSIGSLSIGNGMTIGGSSAANIDLELDTNAGTNDSITVSGAALTFGAGGGVISVTEIAGDATTAPAVSTFNLLTDSAGLGLDSFSLAQSSLLIAGQNYLLTLSTANGGTTEVLNITPASLNFYWTGTHSTSWNNITNFATTIAGTQAQAGSLSASSNVFLTATSSAVTQLPKTLDGNYTINSLSFTGTGTANQTGSITLGSGTATGPLTIAAQGAFGDAAGNVYGAGTGIVVQPGADTDTITAPIALGNSQTWYVNNTGANPLTVSVVEDGTNGAQDSLTKSGPGTLILNAAETYNGGTIVNNGTLALGSSGSLNSAAGLTVTGTGTFDLAGRAQIVSGLSDGGVSTGVITSSTGAATLTIDNSTSNTYSGAIADNNGVNGASLALLLEGSSNVTLSGSSTFTGGTNLTNGNLTVAANYALGSPTSTNPNAGLTINPALSGSVTAIFTSANPHIAALDSGTNGIADVYLGNGTGNTATTLNVGASGLASVFNGSILNSGTTVNTAAIGNLVVAGGSLTLDGSDGYTGTTSVAAGTLILGNTNALAGSIVNYNNQGGTLSFGSLNGATFGGLEGAENLALSNTSATPITLTIQSSSNTANYSGALSGSGSLVISSSNATQTFSGVNTYTGTTTLGATTSGTTIIASTGAIGTPGSPSGALSQTINSTLTVSGSIYVTSIASNGGAIFNVSSGAIVSSTGTMAINANNADSNGLLSITGGTVTANAVTVGRDGTNDGATLPTAGGTADGIYVNGGALNVATTLGVGTPAADNSTANFRMDAGSVTVGGIATITNDAGSRFSVLDINGGTFTDQDTSGVGVLIGGNADGNGLLLAELLVRNTGVLNTPAITLGSAAQTSGTDYFNAMGGTTIIGSGGIVSGTGTGATVVVDLGSGSSAVAPTITASASWSSSLPMVLANSGNSGPNFLTTSGSNITLTGNLTGGGGLTAEGTGILTLGGVDTYTGATAVTGTGGRLLVSGSVSGTISISVTSGANLEVDGFLNSTNAALVSGRLSGIGSVDGATVLSTGTLAAGFSTGSTTAGTLTSTGAIAFSSTTGTLSIRVGLTTGASGDNDQLAITNGAALTLDDTTLRLSPGAAEGGAPQDALYVIVNGGAQATGSGTDVFVNAPASGDSITMGSEVFDVFYGVNSGNTGPGSDIDVELAAVPEPGAWAEIIAGLGILCIWQRSRRKVRRNTPDSLPG
jgi:autotransporter-associated beta strand protein